MNDTETSQDSARVVNKYAPFIVHRRSPGLHWWTDQHGKDHGPYVHQRIAVTDALRARKRQAAQAAQAGKAAV